MSFLKLEDISKIYVGNVVSVGLSRINLDFDLGEFVAVTGKSGSGKTTLLNVISGMDSYEEGELYINSQPTSHFTQGDFENYREEFISFVFQDYNIIDSFTVLENVELSLMHIKNVKERKKRALELIERVGLTEAKNQKGAKLSGGQKQRTVIARALAKDSPIILADEPTGNLDSETSKQIVKLLKEVSTDKLVIVVTHNFEEFEEYATRHIRIYDGKVEFDDHIKDYKKAEYQKNEVVEDKFENIKNAFHLGLIRFKSQPKLAFVLSLLLTITLIGLFFVTSLCSSSITDLKGYDIFEYVEGRVVISNRKTDDISAIELEELKTKTKALEYIKYDEYIDNYRFEFMYQKLIPTRELVKPDDGRLPEKDNEVMLYLPIYMKEDYETLIYKEYDTDFLNYYEIVGVKYFKDNNKTAKVYLAEKERARAGYILELRNHSYWDIMAIADDDKELFQVNFSLRNSDGNKRIILNERDYVKYQEAILEYPDTFKFDIGDGYCVDYKDINVEKGNVNTISMDLLVSAKEYENSTYNQASFFFKNDREANKAISIFKENGYSAFLSTTRYNNIDQLEVIVNSIFLIFLWIILVLFLSLFSYLCTYKLIMTTKSDIGIYRSMGIKKDVIKKSIYFYLSSATIPAIIALFIISFIVFTIPRTNGIFPYLYWYHYLIMVIGIGIIIMKISKKFTFKIFDSSVRKNLKGGNEND